MSIIKKIIRYPITLSHYLLKLLFYLAGYNLQIKYKKRILTNEINKLNLNIGAGNYIIDGFKSLDLYSKHYYPDKNSFLKDRIEYDLRKDKIPFDDNSVDNIYISHVIEHVEDKFVIRFINESYRVLKPNCVLRIVCPDGKFLFKISQFKNDYWHWRKVTSFSNKDRYLTDWNNIEQYDYLVREVSTPNCRYYKNKVLSNFPNNEDLKKLNYDEFKKLVSKNLIFRKDHPGDHINLHDYESLKKMGISAGFSNIIESKKLGSVSSIMQSDEFDRTAPQMSLYVDMVK